MYFRPDTKYETVIMDKMRNEFYIVYRNDAVCGVRKVNLSNGTVNDAFEIHEVSFIENIQIFDEWIYFLKPTNDFQKLYRVRIKDPAKLE